MKKHKTINGQNIDAIMTLKSWYDHNCIEVKVNNEWFRIHTSEILRMMHEFAFDVSKKRVHKYLTVRSMFLPHEGFFADMDTLDEDTEIVW